MTVSIKIHALNGTRIVPVKAGNEQAIYPTDTPTGLAVLRLIPTTEDIWATGTNEVYVQGGVYADTEEMIQYIPYTVECTLTSVDYVNVYAKKTSDSTYLQVGKKLDATGTLYFGLLATDFDVNDAIDIKVEDYDNSIVYDESSSYIYATVGITTPIELTAGTAGTVSGTSNGSEVEVFYRIAGGSPENAWVSAGTASVIAESYTKSVTIATAETYDIKVEDTTDTDGFAQVDDVVVESGVKIWTIEDLQYLTRTDSDGSNRTEIYTTGIATNPIALSRNDAGYFVILWSDYTLKIYSPSFSVVATISISGQLIQDIAIDETHLYAFYGNGTDTVAVKKYLLSDGSLVATSANFYQATGNYFSKPVAITLTETDVIIAGGVQGSDFYLSVRSRLKSDFSSVAFDASSTYVGLTPPRMMFNDGVYLYSAHFGKLWRRPVDLSSDWALVDTTTVTGFIGMVGDMIVTRDSSSQTKLNKINAGGSQTTIYTSTKDISMLDKK